MAKTIQELQTVATQVRRDILRMVCQAKSGHPGGSMSSTDILTALYFQEMNQDPTTWRRDGKGQDMFILSAGHMTPVYYSVLARAGYFPVSELATFPGWPPPRNWTETLTSCTASAETARARKARSGKPACSPSSTSWTTSSP